MRANRDLTHVAGIRGKSQMGDRGLGAGEIPGKEADASVPVMLVQKVDCPSLAGTIERSPQKCGK